MHSGIMQLIINLLVHIRLGMQVEKRVHSGRYATIWLVSGVFGYLFGSLFVPEGNGKCAQGIVLYFLSTFDIEFSQYGLLCSSHGHHGISVCGSHQALAYNSSSAKSIALHCRLLW